VLVPPGLLESCDRLEFGDDDGLRLCGSVELSDGDGRFGAAVDASLPLDPLPVERLPVELLPLEPLPLEPLLPELLPL
jgi:hypothetical protein